VTSNFPPNSVSPAINEQIASKREKKLLSKNSLKVLKQDLRKQSSPTDLSSGLGDSEECAGSGGRPTVSEAKVTKNMNEGGGDESSKRKKGKVNSEHLDDSGIKA